MKPFVSRYRSNLLNSSTICKLTGKLESLPRLVARGLLSMPIFLFGSIKTARIWPILTSCQVIPLFVNHAVIYCRVNCFCCPGETDTRHFQASNQISVGRVHLNRSDNSWNLFHWGWSLRVDDNPRSTVHSFHWGHSLSKYSRHSRRSNFSSRSRRLSSWGHIFSWKR